MNVGLTAAQGAGKTTLGAEFAKHNPHFTFAATSVREIMAHHGFDPGQVVPFADRLRIQNIILDELDQFYGRFRGYTVFDRTPLDVAAYMLGDIGREGLSTPEHEAAVKFLDRCFEITNRRFSLIVFIPSVLTLVAEPGRGPVDVGYVEHIQQLMNGLRMDNRMRVKHATIYRQTTDLTERRLGLERFVTYVLGNYMQEAHQRIADGAYAH